MLDYRVKFVSHTTETLYRTELTPARDTSWLNWFMQTKVYDDSQVFNLFK